MAGKQNRIDNEQEFKDKVRSIHYMLSKGDTLIKSNNEGNTVMSEHDLFNSIKIKKTGEEMKAAVNRMVDVITGKKEKSKIIMLSILKEVDCQPKGSMREDWRVQEYPAVFSYIPTKFEYGQIYNQTDGSLIDKEKGEKMQRYNREANMYINNCLDAAKLSKVSESIKEKATYNISPNFALKLGL